VNRYSHIGIGLAAGIGSAAYLGRLDLAWPSALVAAGAAMIPDFDVRFGLPERRRWYSIRDHAWIAERACRPMKRALEHRGAMHAPIVAMLLGMAVGLVFDAAWIMLAAQAGYLSHVLADAPSPMGVPLLWPLSKKRYRLGPVKITSGNRRVEWPLAVAILLGTMWLTGLGLPR
jgi:inner membrane protein